MKPSTLFVVIGVLVALLGVVAVSNPFAASLAVTTFVGILFLIGGVAQAWLVFQDRTGEHRLWHGLVSFLNIIVGVWLMANPLQGTVSLTLVVGLLFLVMGALRLVVGFQMGVSVMRTLLLVTGAASVLIGVLIFSDFRHAATTVLGLLLGIQLLVDGVGLVALGIGSGASHG